MNGAFDAAQIEQRVIKKLLRRFLPFLGLCYIVLYLDRTNIGVAALTMNDDLGISASVFGFASGVYYWTYTLFEIPSNKILTKVGASLWIPRIMITWGLVTIGIAFVQGEVSLVVMRMFLGIAEAGFSPGVLFFLTLWFPARVRGRVFSIIISFIAGSAVLLPAVTATLKLDGLAGLEGWRWTFIVTGIPAVVMGFLCYRVLIDHPGKATFLTDPERRWLVRTLEAERREMHGEQVQTFRHGMTDARVWIFVAAWIGFTYALNGYSFFLPQILQEVGFSISQIGWVGALPALVAIPCIVLWCRHSDHTMDRRWHYALSSALGAVGFFALAGFLERPGAAVAVLVLCAIGMYCAMATFYLNPVTLFSGASAAAALAVINGIGNVGGYFGPQLTGILRDQTGGYGAAIATYGVALLVSGVLVLVVTSDRRAPAPQLEMGARLGGGHR
jgi:MFS transporter, ACS family, tartrate transporter